MFDYCFLGGAGKEETLSVQVTRDIGSKMLFAHVVPKEGLCTNHGLTQLMKDID